VRRLPEFERASLLLAPEQRQFFFLAGILQGFASKNSSVDHQSLSTKIARLRTELHQIGVANRKYFEKKSHSAEERATHLRRQERISEIKAELETILGSQML
jgi:hypothetical protein